MTYDGPERRDDTELREDIAALAAQVHSLDDTIRTAFVRREELQEYPDFEVMYARMEVLEDRLEASRRKSFWQLIGGFLIAALILSAVGFYGAHERNEQRIQSDIRSCERGNRTRAVVRAAGEANEEMWRGVRDDLFPAEGRAAAYRKLLDRRLVELDAANDQLEGDVDCVASAHGKETS